MPVKFFLNTLFFIICTIFELHDHLLGADCETGKVKHRSRKDFLN